MKKLLVTIIAVIILIGCAGRQDPVPVQPPPVIEAIESEKQGESKIEGLCFYGVTYLVMEYIDQDGTEALAATVMLYPNGMPVPCIEEEGQKAGRR